MSKNSSEVVKVGVYSLYDFSMFLTPRTITSYKLEVAVDNEALSVCRILMSNRGSNIPCLFETAKPVYISHQNDTQRDKAIYDMFNVANIGQWNYGTSPNRYYS